MFSGAEVADKQVSDQQEKDNSAEEQSSGSDTVTVTIGMTKEFDKMCNTLADKVKHYLTGGQTTADQIAGGLATALNKVTDEITKLLSSAFPEISSVTVDDNGSGTIEVKINNGNTNIGEAATVTVKPSVGSQDITINIQVKGLNQSVLGDDSGKKGERIAKWVAAALVSDQVKVAVQEKQYTITAQGTGIKTVDGNPKQVNGGVQLQVKVHRSWDMGSNDEKKVANNIRDKIIDAVEATDKSSKTNRGAYEYLSGSAKIKIYVTVKMMVKMVVLTYGMKVD